MLAFIGYTHIQMPANVDKFITKRTGDHPSNPQETRKPGAPALKTSDKSSGTVNLGLIIKNGRKALGWSQEVLAQKSTFDVKTIQNVENGRTEKPDTLRVLRDILDKNLTEKDKTKLAWPTEGCIVPVSNPSAQLAPDGVEVRSPTGKHSLLPILPATGADMADDEHLERRYVALARDGLYDDAALLAQNALNRAEDRHDQKAVAHWADRVADAYRCSGKLRQASSFYAKSWSYAQQALEKSPDDEQLRYQEAKTRFGQIMVDDFLIRGAFSEAYLRHSQLLNDAKSLIADVKSAPLKADIILRSTHVKRQQAEMLRLQGRYEESVAKIREVLAEYPESAFEPRNYARLSEADSLRLKGQAKEALPIYDALEKLASERRQDGFLGAVLWRKTGALQCENKLNERELVSCLTQLESIAESQAERYRFVAIYSLLACAAGRIPDADRANRALQKAEAFGPLSRDYLRTEYAHLALCRGELFRTTGKLDEANTWFSKAFECYIKMTVRWGVVRSWIGLQLTGKKVEFPKLDGRTLEGLDATLLARFSKGENMPRGILSANLP